MHRVLRSALFLLVSALVLLSPGLSLVRDLRDPALAGSGVPQHAITLHRDLSPRIERWARERIAGHRAAHTELHDVPTNEWPMFTSVFYLLGTRELEAAWHRGELGDAPEPLSYARGAVDAARDLVIDPVHHTWVRAHWGDDYFHEQNVFFRALVISALTNHMALTHDRSDELLLRDQVDTLAAELDRSPLGLLNDYPNECYPIDVLVAVAWIREADALLGTDHSAFVERELRAFTGAQADDLGLVRFRVDLSRDLEHAYDVQPGRGTGMSWVLSFAPELWPSQSRDWYARYARTFWQDHGWAAGFREYAPGTEAENGFEIDAGPVLDGFGTASSAFGIAAARRNGRFDQAWALETEMSAVSWTLPDGTMLLPRMVSHAADAPYLGEAALQYVMTVQARGRCGDRARAGPRPRPRALRARDLPRHPAARGAAARARGAPRVDRARGGSEASWMLAVRHESTSIWCSERSASELDDYFDDDDGARISRFTRDLGTPVYERDWLERIESAAHGHGSVGALIRRTGGGAEMEASLGDVAQLPARVVVVLYHADVADFPRELDGGPHPLRHLGNVATPSVVRR